MPVRFLAFILIMIFLVGCGACKTSKPIAIIGFKPKTLKQLQDDTLLAYTRDTLPNGNIIINPNYSLVKSDSSFIKLSFFDSIPETISKSGEFYTYDTTRISKNKYIFLTDIVVYAVIRINGKDVYLHKDYDKCLEISDNVFREVYSGNGYTIIFTHKDLRENHGIHFATGTLDIKNEKYGVTLKIHGSLVL